MTAKVIDKVLEGGVYVDKEYIVPEEQAWLAVMLERQTNALKSMRSMLQFFVLLAIVGIVVQGCTVLLSTPLR